LWEGVGANELLGGGRSTNEASTKTVKWLSPIRVEAGSLGRYQQIGWPPRIRKSLNMANNMTGEKKPRRTGGTGNSQAGGKSTSAR